MKVRLVLSLCMAALFAFGSASATDAGVGSNPYLALGDSIAFAFIDQAGYEYYYPTNFVGYVDWTRASASLHTSRLGLCGTVARHKKGRQPPIQDTGREWSRGTSITA
jgi:hypothetical protein